MRPPGRRSQSEPHLIRKGDTREGEPGALHLGVDAAGVDGVDHWCRDSVALAMKNVFKAQAFRIVMAPSALASSALVIEAGQRWHR
jgi:hypothetical protein